MKLNKRKPRVPVVPLPTPFQPVGLVVNGLGAVLAQQLHMLPWLQTTAVALPPEKPRGAS